MTPPRTRHRFAYLTVLMAALLVCALSAPAAVAGSASADPEPAGSPDVDVRNQRQPSTPATAEQLGARSELADVSIRWNVRTGVPSELVRYGGTLTEESDSAPEDVARAFLLEHRELYGATADDIANLVVTSEAVTEHNGVTQLVFGQLDAGRDVFGASLLFSIDREGRILITGGPFYPGAAAEGSPSLSAAEAARKAAESVGAEPQEPDPTPTNVDAAAAVDPKQQTVLPNIYADPRLTNPSPITAELVTFPPTARIEPRLAWKTVLEIDSEGWYEIVVDADSGDVLYRQNLYDNAAAEGNVFNCESPDVCGQSIVPFPGWVTANTTSGNNANAYQDLSDTNAVGYQPTTPACPDPTCQHFDYTFTDTYGTGALHDDVTTDRDSVVTQLFWATNFMHDYLYGLGFTEPFRNFQVNNFGLGGAGNDPVLAEADDGFAIGNSDNANFFTPADGTSPRMQMFVWTTPFTDGSMDADIVFHEYTHGLVRRLVGGGTLGTGTQTAGLNEGTADSVAVSINNNAVLGEYANGDATTGIRRVAYDNSNLTYGDLCNAGCESHNDGEIWASTLWDLRTRLISTYGFAAGKSTHELLIVDGLKGTATNPTFLTARDAILAADTANNGGTNECLIWQTFAGRGLGVSATSAANQMTVTEATDVPAQCRIDTTTSLTSSVNPSVFGQPVSFTATVSPPPSAGPAFDDGGSVSFTIDGGAPVVRDVDKDTGIAVLPPDPTLAVGTHTVTASYGGTTIYNTSAATITQTVTRAPVVTTLTSSPNPVLFGDPVTFTDTVCAAPPSTDPTVPPSGPVVFRDGPTVLGSPSLVPGGGANCSEATLTTSSLLPGSHTITADYGGDGNYLPAGTETLPTPQVVACVRNLTGLINGPVVTRAASTCIIDATVEGAVTGLSGALFIGTSQVNGPVTSNDGTLFALCASRVEGSIAVRRASRFVVIGDPGDKGCSSNEILGSVALLRNRGGIELILNRIGGTVEVANTSGHGPFPDDVGSEIEGNTIAASLFCSGNVPPPTNDGRPNIVSGTRGGQCRLL